VIGFVGRRLRVGSRSCKEKGCGEQDDLSHFHMSSCFPIGTGIVFFIQDSTARTGDDHGAIPRRSPATMNYDNSFTDCRGDDADFPQGGGASHQRS